MEYNFLRVECAMYFSKPQQFPSRANPTLMVSVFTHSSTCHALLHFVRRRAKSITHVHSSSLSGKPHLPPHPQLSSNTYMNAEDRNGGTSEDWPHRGLQSQCAQRGFPFRYYRSNVAVEYCLRRLREKLDSRDKASWISSRECLVFGVAGLF